MAKWQLALFFCSFLHCTQLDDSLDRNGLLSCNSVGFCFKLWSKGRKCSFTPSLKRFSEWSAKLASPPYLELFPIDYLNINKPREVKKCIFSVSKPTGFRNTKLAAISKKAIKTLLELNPNDVIISKDFLDFASGLKTINEIVALAHRYGGHQFGVWADQLGDGRAHLIAEYTNNFGITSELQLKGSGITPYSRRGDGKAVIRSSVREFLCSEALHGLGVPTSRALSLVVNDEPVMRDQFYDGNVKTERGAIVMRSAPSWFRIGSLEILSFHHEERNLKLLVDHMILNFFNGDIEKYKELSKMYNIAYDSINNTSIDLASPQKYLDFFANVQNLTISMVVEWMSFGFAHGVCNTDNFSLLGMTIDFGPFGFVDSHDPNFVPNTSDDEGRYSINNQPNVAKENMAHLLQALSLLLTNEEKLIGKKILQTFDNIYLNLLLDKFGQKLGLSSKQNDDEQLIGGLLYLMEQTKADFTMTFYELTSLSDKQLQNINTIPSTMWALTSMKEHDLFDDWITLYRERLELNPHNFVRKSMKNANPRYVLRNWIAETAIQKAEQNDFSDIHILLEILLNPFDVNEEAEKRGYANHPPYWSKNLRVTCSS